MKLIIFSFLFFGFYYSLSAQNYQYQAVKMDFQMPVLDEKSQENPFLDYRLEITFTQNNLKYVVPGFFAADGKAAETSATKGNVWRVYFTPPYFGTWNYEVSFMKGENLAVNSDPYQGLPVLKHHGKKGSIVVLSVPSDAKGFLASGRLIYNTTRYLHTQNGKPWLKFGPNSPENFFAYNQFDGTYGYDETKNFPKTWEPHLKDWKTGDPTWQNGKGKGIIGALNYIASKGMNVVYALTMNIEGDAKDVWPFLSHLKKDHKRYDISKLAQWDIVISHAEKLGIALNLVTQEKENELLLDNGDTGLERKLYYRELVARFAHHNNIIWNMGEENGQVPFWWQGQNDQQRYAMIRYLKDLDPYKNPLVIHSMSTKEHRDPILMPLLGFDRLDGISLQVHHVEDIHETILDWQKKSIKAYNRPWVMMMDEIGPWHTGTRTDQDDPKHDTLRQEVLWGTLMAGGAGVEWYFGWLKPPHDLNAEDWRSRNNIWDQSAIAKRFFEQIPFTEMETKNDLLQDKTDYCFRKSNEVYVVYSKKGINKQIDLSEAIGTFKISWYNPRTGGSFLNGSLSEINGGQKANLGSPSIEENQDWVILLKRK